MNTMTNELFTARINVLQAIRNGVPQDGISSKIMRSLFLEKLLVIDHSSGKPVYMLSETGEQYLADYGMPAEQKLAEIGKLFGQHCALLVEVTRLRQEAQAADDRGDELVSNNLWAAYAKAEAENIAASRRIRALTENQYLESEAFPLVSNELDAGVDGVRVATYLSSSDREMVVDIFAQLSAGYELVERCVRSVGETREQFIARANRYIKFAGMKLQR